MSCDHKTDKHLYTMPCNAYHQIQTVINFKRHLISCGPRLACSKCFSEPAILPSSNQQH